MFIKNNRWANQCKGEANVFHDKNRRTRKFSYAGQNYATKSHSSSLAEKFLSKMIQDLYDEVSAFLQQGYLIAIIIILNNIYY